MSLRPLGSPAFDHCCACCAGMQTIQAMHIRMTSLSGAPCWRPLRQHSGACDSVGPSGTLGPRPEEFYSLFPFHFVMDRRFRLLQAGAGMRKVLPEMVPGTQVNELLTVRGACTVGAQKAG